MCGCVVTATQTFSKTVSYCLRSYWCAGCTVVSVGLRRIVRIYCATLTFCDLLSGITYFI